MWFKKTKLVLIFQILLKKADLAGLKSNINRLAINKLEKNQVVKHFEK